MATLEMRPPPPLVLGEPVAREQSCEACGAPVRFLTVTSPSGAPDFVRALFPSEAWFGWQWADEQRQALAIITLCSRACHVEWFDGEHGPGA